MCIHCKLVKVTVYLQGCLMYKQYSTSGLNCRYIKPYNYYQIIAYRTYYQTIHVPTSLKRNELSNFSRLLNVSARITFWTVHVRGNFVFRLFNVSLSFRAQSTLKKLSMICHIQFQWKVTQHFWNTCRIKKIWSVRTKITLIEKIFWKKKFSNTVTCMLFMCLSTHCQILGSIGQIPYEF